MSAKLEQLMQTYMREKEAKDSLEAKLESLKTQIGKELADSGEETALTRWNEDQDIKATHKPKSSSKLDKPRLAERMRVDEKVLTNDFLLKAIDDRKLDYETYKQYFFVEREPVTSIRLVKAL